MLALLFFQGDLPPELAGLATKLGPWALFAFLLFRHFFDGTRKALTAAVASLEQVTKQVAAMEAVLLNRDIDGLSIGEKIAQMHQFLTTKDADGVRHSALRELTDRILERLADVMELDADTARRQVEILEKLPVALAQIGARLEDLERGAGKRRAAPGG